MKRTVLLATAAGAAIAWGCSPAPAASRAGASPAPAAAGRTLRYWFITAGRPSGDGEIVIGPDGSRRSRYQINDRGRGPDITTLLILDENGAVRTARSTGNNYWKAPVDETVETQGGEIAWKSTIEQGKAARGAGFFLLNDGPFDGWAVLARALQRAPGKRLAILPAGEAWIEDEATLQVELEGRTRRLHMVALAGLGFSPGTVWLDEDGELFAQVSTWWSTIARGAESLVPRLIAEDEKWMQARAARLATELVEPPPAAGLAITHARLFDSENRRVRENVTVVVVGDRITAVGGPPTRIPTGARVVDAGGRTLLPGLWDMHVHVYGTADGILDLATGITTIRDLGNDIQSLGARMARYDAGTEVGPRVFRAGLIDGPGPLAAPTGLLVDNEEEARAAVERLAGLGYSQIKLYSTLKPELVPSIAKDAHSRGLRVSGHIPHPMNAAQAVEAGYDEIQHAYFLYLNFLAGPADDTRTPRRLTLVAEKAGTFDLSSPEVGKFLDHLVTHKTVLDPTLVTFEDMFTSGPGELRPEFVAYAGRLPAQVERGGRAGGLPADGDKRAVYRASHAALGKFVKKAWDRGIRIVPGTDATPGLAYARELELYVAAGIPPADVLALATIGAARVMSADKRSGSIAVGKQADMVLIDGDPLRDIGAIRNTDLVVCRGRIYDPAKLFAAVGMRARQGSEGGQRPR